MVTVAEELSSLVSQMPLRDQERVLSFARALTHPATFRHSPLPSGAPPDALLRIQLDSEVGEAIEQAIDDCERIDLDE